MKNIDESLLTYNAESQGKRWLCYCCYDSLKQKKVPSLSLANGLHFPERPQDLELTSLEERLVAPRIPFMVIYEKARGGQYAVKGNVVNVPVDVNKTIRVLPRMLNDCETIPVKLKRKQSYKHHVLYQNIRPNKVLNAARYLVSNSTLFKNEGITVDESWLENYQTALVNNQDDNIDNKNTSTELESENSSVVQDKNLNHGLLNSSFSENGKLNGSTTISKPLYQTDDEFSEVDMHDKVDGNLDTVMHPADFREFNQILNLAPGEGNVPLSLYEDKDAEYLAFPSVYAGTSRDYSKFKVPIYYSQVVKWELRNIDRRVATNVPLIFFKMKKVQIKLMRDKVSMAVRKFKSKGKKLTAGEVVEPGGIDKLVKLDEGYRVLKSVRSSPPYWEQAKKDIFGMIRQLGLPTLFLSFSAAETKWVPLLQTLSKLSDNKELSDEEVNNLSWQDRCRLIKSDPVTCVRYFDHKVQKFINMVLKHPSHPVGEIKDFFYRVEFQNRGSPHIHMLLWIANAPTFSPEYSESNEITDFIDKYISCQKGGANPDLINYQSHRHAKTCRKKGKAICRFGYPLPPMPKTMILTPLCATDRSKQAKLNLVKINEALNNAKQGDESTFEEFLSKLELNFDSYILAVRSGLATTKVFLKRSLAEIRINSYNKVLLESWEANMDIQFIIDAFSCVSYIVSYISKGQRGMSNLLSDASREAKDRASGVRDQVRSVCNKFLTHVEIGAQEAVYLLLQIPLRKSSRAVKFINTSPPEERTVLLKPNDVLEKMAKNSTDIETDNILKQYTRRPKVLENVCLADYVAWFEIRNYKKKCNVDQDFNLDSENPENDDSVEMSDLQEERTITTDPNDTSNRFEQIDSNTSDTESTHITLTYQLPKEIELKNGLKLVKRKFEKVIRYVRFNVDIDRENHFREKLMLFLPWRNENIDLMATFSTYEEHYTNVQSHISTKQALYERVAPLNNIDENVSLDNDDAIDSSTDDIDQTEISAKYGCFNPDDKSLHQSYDLGIDLGIRKSVVGVNVVSEALLPESKYRETIRSLNKEQKCIFYHILHWFKVNTDEPLYAFLSGGAGVGKSVTTRAMYQALYRFFSHQIDSCPDDVRILMCAPTGKAAHNIGGNTLHSAFHIPANQSLSYKPLDMQQLNTLRSKYAALSVVFIDEISMVGNRMFNYINMRLQEVKGNLRPFGGVSIIAIGDLYQLKPVMDGWIFLDIKAGYGPLGSNLWIDHFLMYELQTIMRQKDDKIFAEFLNRLREGNHTNDDLRMIKERAVNNKDPRRPLADESLPHLFTTRREVFAYNEKIYCETNNAKCMVKAVDSVCGDMTIEISQKNIGYNSK